MPDQNDHDLIIEIKTIQEMMLNEIKEIKSGTSRQIADHETRLKALENSKGQIKLAAWGAYVLGTGIFGLVVYHMLNIK